MSRMTIDQAIQAIERALYENKPELVVQELGKLFPHLQFVLVEKPPATDLKRLSERLSRIA